MDLKSIVESFIRQNEAAEFSSEDREKVLGMISEYNSLGDSLSRQGNLLEIAETMEKIAESAEGIAMAESSKSEFFNSKVVQDNMKTLKKQSATFSKLAKDAYGVEQQLTALYEDMGHILNRYFDINDTIDEEQSFDDL